MLLPAGSKTSFLLWSFSVGGLHMSAGILRFSQCSLVPWCGVVSCVPLPLVHLLWTSPSVLCYMVHFSCYLCVSLKTCSILDIARDGCD